MKYHFWYRRVLKWNISKIILLDSKYNFNNRIIKTKIFGNYPVGSEKYFNNNRITKINFMLDPKTISITAKLSSWIQKPRHGDIGSHLQTTGAIGNKNRLELCFCFPKIPISMSLNHNIYKITSDHSKIFIKPMVLK